MGFQETITARQGDSTEDCATIASRLISLPLRAPRKAYVAANL